MKPRKPERHLTVRETAEALGLHIETVRKFLREGERRSKRPHLVGTKRVGVWFVSQEAIAEFRARWAKGEVVA